ncbi:MAG TPA: hypothetical protein VJB57_13530, partial [Dehalococcoidia bacterium]|nr:hypothetical protein [Dehalococcoidia bacterium]
VAGFLVRTEAKRTAYFAFAGLCGNVGLAWSLGHKSIIGTVTASNKPTRVGQAAAAKRIERP